MRRIIVAKKETKKDKKPKETKVDKKVAPKRAPQKKSTEVKATKKAMIKPMVHIDDFVGLATEVYGLNTMQQAGFKAYMTGKHYLSDMEAFVPYLEKYLGK